MAEESIKKTHWLKPSRGEWTVDHDDRSVEEVKGLIAGIRRALRQTGVPRYLEPLRLRRGPCPHRPLGWQPCR
ncbi:hypothetical protein GCM10018965_064690 [Nonomuraea roseola]